jgi:hypothetical protein
MLVFRPPKRVPTLRLRVSRVEDIEAGTGDFCIAGFRQPRSPLPPFVQGGSQLKAVAGLRNHWLSGGLPDVDAHSVEIAQEEEPAGAGGRLLLRLVTEAPVRALPINRIASLLSRGDPPSVTPVRAAPLT